MSPDPSLWAILTALGGVLSVLAMAFALGYNWRRVSVLERDLDRRLHAEHQQIADIAETYARKDLISLELKALRSRIDYMSKQLAAVLREAPYEDRTSEGG